jgi:tetratricopeptide (TPR) repeat protein
MRVPILAFVAIAQLALSGCAIGPEHRVLREAGTPVELVQVPFFPQDQYQCGPAALATVLVDSGVDITPQQLVSRVYVPDREGSLQAEMLAATRSQGRVPYVLPQTLAPMLAELRAGRPVMMLQNLGLDRWPIWHYAVVIGFDPAAEEFLLRSGVTRRKAHSAVPFLASWDRGGRWSMVAVNPRDPPAGADVLGWLRALGPFESTGHLDLAAEGYEAAVARWPGEAMAWTALGNVRYLQRDLAAAEEAYLHALALSPAFWTACNNLAQTRSELAAAGEYSCDGDPASCAMECGAAP